MEQESNEWEQHTWHMEIFRQCNHHYTDKCRYSYPTYYEFTYGTAMTGKIWLRGYNSPKTPHISPSDLRVIWARWKKTAERLRVNNRLAALLCHVMNLEMFWHTRFFDGFSLIWVHWSISDRLSSWQFWAIFYICKLMPPLLKNLFPQLHGN